MILRSDPPLSTSISINVGPMGDDEIASRLAEQTKNCSRLCSHCGVSLCINSSHQPWQCECGHPRLAHFHPMAAYWGMTLNWMHPHECAVPSCPCRGLRYPEHILFSSEELMGRLGDMDDEMASMPDCDEG